jgi:hypothetical protein
MRGQRRRKQQAERDDRAHAPVSERLAVDVNRDGTPG